MSGHVCFTNLVEHRINTNEKESCFKAGLQRAEQIQRTARGQDAAHGTSSCDDPFNVSVTYNSGRS